MVIQIDSREKPAAVKRILQSLDCAGIRHFVSKLYVGDYATLDNPRLVIDRKKDLTELATNVTTGHDRFSAELQRAAELGIRVIVLCENGGRIKKIDDVIGWQNPMAAKIPHHVDGERLYRILCTMRERHGLDLRFCEKHQTGQAIIHLLGGVAVLPEYVLEPIHCTRCGVTAAPETRRKPYGDGELFHIEARCAHCGTYLKNVRR
jgi:ERCC4-type nuclease